METTIPATPIEAPAPETPAPATPTPQLPRDPEVSDRIARLAQREKEYVRRQQQFKSREAELKARESKLSEIESLRDVARTNPLAVLEKFGLTYQQLTDFMLNDAKPTPEHQVQSVREEIEKLKKAQEEKEQRAQKERQEMAQREAQETIEAFKESINEFVEAQSEEYEFTNLYGGQDLIYETIAQHFAATKKVMTTKEAADLVESYLEEQFLAGQKTKKYQTKFRPSAEANEPAPGAGQPSSRQLNNAMSSSAPSMLPPQTEADRMARALKALG